MKQTLRLFSFFVLTALLVSAVPAAARSAEKITVRGTVKDTFGMPLVGVSVFVEGTHIGVNTNLKGEYQISVPEGGTLRFTYIGYEPQTVKIEYGDRFGLRFVYDVTLKEQATDIGQVVVTGFAKTEIRKSTGSVAVIEGKDLKTSPLEGVDKLLQGKLAGVSVQSVSGRPEKLRRFVSGERAPSRAMPNRCGLSTGFRCRKACRHLRFRTARSDPGDFSNIFATGVGGINPSDIESISVLKDAAAAAIYGSQAAGGVIVVTTKRGKAGPTHVNYSGTVSIQTRPTRSANLMNSREKLAWEQELWVVFSQRL